MIGVMKGGAKSVDYCSYDLVVPARILKRDRLVYLHRLLAFNRWYPVARKRGPCSNSTSPCPDHKQVCVQLGGKGKL